MPIFIALLWISAGSARAATDFRPVLVSSPALDPRHADDFPKILDRVSQSLLGHPYRLGPLGEGEDAAHPLYRLDVFDCTTFLETVMANAYCYRDRRPTCLRGRMQAIRYAGDRTAFAERNHIPETDWLPRNEERGFLLDLSAKLFPGAWKTAQSSISRALWLADHGVAGAREAPASALAYLPASYFFEKAPLTPAQERARNESRDEAQGKIAAAKQSGADAHELEKLRFRAELAYLRVSYAPIAERLRAIPSGTVLNLVRAPEKDPQKAKRTTLVSHQGLVIQTKEGPRIRHASPGAGHVSEQDLADYLLRYVESAHYRGVALFQILPLP